MELSRRRFLTGLGLGGVAVVAPKVFLDVGLAMREGHAHHQKKEEDKWWSYLPHDKPHAKHLMNPDGTFRDFERTHIARPNGLWVPSHALYVDTYVDKVNGEIWDVDVRTNVASRRDQHWDRLSHAMQTQVRPKDLKDSDLVSWIIESHRSPRQMS